MGEWKCLSIATCGGCGVRKLVRRGQGDGRDKGCYGGGLRGVWSSVEIRLGEDRKMSAVAAGGG